MAPHVKTADARMMTEAAFLIMSLTEITLQREFARLTHWG